MYLIALEDFYKGKFFQHVDFHKKQKQKQNHKSKTKNRTPHWDSKGRINNTLSKMWLDRPQP